MKPTVLLLLAAGLIAASCSSDHAAPSAAHAGSSSQAGEAGDSPLDATQFGLSDCRVCVAEACAVPETDCNGEPACARYLACLDACPVADSGGADSDCAEACELPASSSLEILARSVTTCREHGYGIDCPCGVEQPPAMGDDLLNQQCSPSEDPNGCYKCEDEKCCESYAACHADAECQAFMDCVKACPGDDIWQCELDCDDAHPDGTALGLRRIACVLARCPGSDECGGQTDACLKCISQRCNAEDAACRASLGCIKVFDCSRDCASTDAECFAACRALDPEGGVLFQTAYGDCPVARCVSECG